MKQEYDEEFEYEGVNSPSKSLRSRPYQFTPDFKPRPHTFSFNQQLETAGSRLALIQTFEILKQMKDAGAKPDLMTYNAALETLGKAGMEEEAWALLDDMLGMHISPDVQTFNLLLLVSFFSLHVTIECGLMVVTALLPRPHGTQGSNQCTEYSTE